MKKLALVATLALGLLASSVSAALAVEPAKKAEKLPKPIPTNRTLAQPYVGGDNGDNINFDGNAKDDVYSDFTESTPTWDKVGTPRIHSNYSSNTDACASCHATHTAAGSNLLQWGGTPSDACMACHDGTLSTTYDVKNGKIAGTGALTQGGKFGTASSMYLSNHNVTGDVTNNVAPGGAMFDTAANDGKGKWAETFDCIACHNPHGQGGNARILNPNVNGYADADKVTEAMDATVETLAAPGADGVTFKASKGNWLVGYPLKVTVEYVNPAGTAVAGAKIIIDRTAGTVQFKNVADVPADGIVVKYFPGLSVKASLTGTYLTANEQIKYDTEPINNFCGACHIDYNTNDKMESAVNLTGEYKMAYRHRVGRKYSFNGVDKGLVLGQNAFRTGHDTNGDGVEDASTAGDGFICLTCHYAHGVDGEIWNDTASKVKNADGTNRYDFSTGELNGGSALKRLPNMATCEACHAKGDATNGGLPY